MKALLDTSTLIAALLPDHVHHAPSHAWLAQAKLGAFEFHVSGHSLAEVYSVLTRMPRMPPIMPHEARQMLHENVCSKAKIVTLSGADYTSLIEAIAQQGISGGLVYDAIIAKAAEMANVDKLVTLNVAHFQKVWPSGTNRIVNTLLTAPTESH